MAFNNYLEDENDKPYFTTNSLAYYYDKMEGFAKAVDGSAKALNLTKEEVEKRLTLYIEQNKNELDQRIAQWDGKLETFDSSVETLLSEWVDDGTLNHVIDSTLIDQRIAPVTAQLEDIVYPSEYFNARLANGQPIDLTLIGDSITAGQGGTGYSVETTNPVIFTDASGVTQYEASYTASSWANKFRNYLLSKNPSNTFHNWGIGGKSTSYWVTNKAKITAGDVRIIMIGTNDRTGTLSSYRTNLLNLLTHVKGNSNYTIVMAAQPLSSQVENFSFTNGDAARVIKEVCQDLKLPLINHYDKFMEFAKLNNPYTDLLSDGIHLNDAGHEVYWQNIQDELKFYDISYQENALNTYKVLPSTFDRYATAFDKRIKVMPTNMQLNPIMDEWSEGDVVGSTKTTGCVAEQVPAFFKGRYAAKLTSTVANASYRFSLSTNNTKEKSKLLVSYESKGVCRFAVFQNGLVSPKADVYLPEGRHNLIIDVPFSDDGTTAFYVRVYPNFTLRDGGYTTIDTIAAIKNSQANFGFFTDKDDINPRWFGVYGDGTDESAKFLSMLQQLGNLTTSRGYRIKLPITGFDYNISGMQNNNKKVIIEGDGIATNLANTIPNVLYDNVAVQGIVRTDVLVRLTDGTQAQLVYNNDGTVTTTPFAY